MAQTPQGAILIAAKKAGISPEDYRSKINAGEKWCTLCRKFHRRSEFGVENSRYDALAPSCRLSRSKSQREKYIPSTGPLLRGKRFVFARLGDKKQARRRINYFVEAGIISPPNDLPCTDCGHEFDGERRHEYDHYLGYGPNHHEVVEPVCSKCHHKRERDRNGNKN